MKTWADFMARVVPHLPGAPEFEIADKLRDAAIEFCERSRIWKTTTPLTIATTVAAQADYNVLTNPAGAGLTHIHAAWVGEDEVWVLRPGEAEDSYPGETAARPAGGGAHWRYKIELTGRAAVRLVPAPESGGEVIKATVSYKPTEVAEGVPDFLYWDWREAIEKRAIAEMMMQAGKPWSSAAAEMHMGRFDKLLFEATNVAGPVRRPGQGLRVRQWG